MTSTTGRPLIFGKKKRPEPKGQEDTHPWKILIVDDEKEVHTVTTLALSGFEFAGQPLTFLHAYSGDEARKILADTDNIALMLLDVVMESDNAGLDLVRYVREKLHNKMIRVVLRTGQPGQAPEKQVVVDYDINDYKQKTELTSQKLFTLVYSSLRAYRDMVALEGSRKGLRKIIDASTDIMSMDSMQNFAEGALDQMLSLLHINDGGSFYGVSPDSLAAFKRGSDFRVLAGTGKFKHLPENGSGLRQMPVDVIDHLRNAAVRGGHLFTDRQIVCYHRGRGDHENLLYVGGEFDFSQIDRSLIELYARSVGVAFENIELYHQVEETQREIVYRLGEAVETRSMETGNHLKRVAEISKLIALEYGVPPDEAERIKYASPLHDVGKIGVPDAILNKPGKHTDEEWAIMKTHAQLGYNMLASSDKPILQAGAIIALEHHEKWDGTGYPHGKSGEDIHLYGRITALADVYDALASERCYKEPWPLGDIYLFIKEQRGKHFQPELVDVLTQNLDKVEHIMMTYRDRFNREPDAKAG